MRTTSTSLFDFRSLLAPHSLYLLISLNTVTYIHRAHSRVRFWRSFLHWSGISTERNRVVGINNKTVFERHSDDGSRDRLFRLRAPPSCVYKIIVPSFLDRQVCAPNYSDRIAGNLGSSGERTARTVVFGDVCLSYYALKKQIFSRSFVREEKGKGRITETLFSTLWKCTHTPAYLCGLFGYLGRDCFSIFSYFSSKCIR